MRLPGKSSTGIPMLSERLCSGLSAAQKYDVFVSLVREQRG